MEYLIFKHKKFFISFISVIFFLSIIITLIFGQGSIGEKVLIIIGFFASLVLGFLALGFVIGFQFINPFSNNRVLKFGCNFFLYSTFVMICASILTVAINIKFILTVKDGYFLFVSIYMTTGAFLSSLFFKNKLNKRQAEEKKVYDESFSNAEAETIGPGEEFETRSKNNEKLIRRKVQRRIVIAISLIAVIVPFIFSIIFFVSDTMKNNAAYKTSIHEIQTDEQIISRVGEIKGYGFMPTGSISVSNGYGKAELTITVKGEKEDIKVFSRLNKEPNSDWEIVEFRIIN